MHQLLGLLVTTKEAPDNFVAIYAGWGDDKIQLRAESTDDDLRLYPCVS